MKHTPSTEVQMLNFVGSKTEITVKQFISALTIEKKTLINLHLETKVEIEATQFISNEVTLAHPVKKTMSLQG